MSELVALVGLAVQGGTWLRRWLRATEPYHRARLELELERMAAEVMQEAQAQGPRRSRGRLAPQVIGVQHSVIDAR